MALVDAHYRFIFIDFGAQGRCSDAGIFSECELNQAMLTNAINVPVPSKLPGTQEVFPYVVVADDAFPLREGIMKPYPYRDLTVAQRIYNYRLSRARRCVENAFGILASRFRVMLSPMCIKPEKVDKVVIAACVLHNMLRTVKPKTYVRQQPVHNLSDGRRNQSNQIPSAFVSSRRTATNMGKYLRDTLCKYFNSPQGAVAWQ
jgi:hypothetical protein